MMSTSSVLPETSMKQQQQQQQQNKNNVSLPPLSSILLSPAESSLRHSFVIDSASASASANPNPNNSFSIPSSNYVHPHPHPHPQPHLHPHHSFQQQNQNIFNVSASSSIHPNNNNNKSLSSNRTFSLPAIDSITSTPNLKRTISYLPQNVNTTIDSTNKSFIAVPVTPLTTNLPIAPIPLITHSTPLHLSYNTTKPIITQPLVIYSNPNTSIPLDYTDSSFIHSTPFKSNIQSQSNISQNDIFSSTNNNLSTKLSNNSKKRKNSIDDTKSFAFISHSQETFLSNEPNIDNARLARRKRRRTSPTELAILKQEFKKGTTPNKQRRMIIADMVDMTEKAVQIWFQNRRQAMRKVQNQNSKQFVVEFKHYDGKHDHDNIDDESDANSEDIDLEMENLSNNNNNNNKENKSPSDATSDSDTDASSLNENDTTTERTENKQHQSTTINTTVDDNKENIDPTSLTSPDGTNSALPPRGIFSSPLSSKKSPSRNLSTKDSKLALADITNQNNNTNSSPGQTFKFKSTNFGLISHTAGLSRRQKPTMKLKLKSGNASSMISNSTKSNEYKHQNLVIFKDSNTK